jgi:hypothetical protein
VAPTTAFPFSRSLLQLVLMHDRGASVDVDLEALGGGKARASLCVQRVGTAALDGGAMHSVRSATTLQTWVYHTSLRMRCIGTVARRDGTVHHVRDAPLSPGLCAVQGCMQQENVVHRSRRRCPLLRPEWRKQAGERRAGARCWRNDGRCSVFARASTSPPAPPQWRRNAPLQAAPSRCGNHGAMTCKGLQTWRRASARMVRHARGRTRLARRKAPAGARLRPGDALRIGGTQRTLSHHATCTGMSVRLRRHQLVGCRARQRRRARERR